jgi:hypothetical protein
VFPRLGDISARLFVGGVIFRREGKKDVDVFAGRRIIHTPPYPLDGFIVLAKSNELPDAVLNYCDQFSAEKSPDYVCGSPFDLVT